MNAAEPGSGRIGPNAVTRVADALGPIRADAIFRAAAIAERLGTPPAHMVPEGEVTALHRALRIGLGEAEADVISREAGRRTAAYLLAHRIPRPLQWLLPRLPASLAARTLIGAIGRHAWTFAGSGGFRAVVGQPLRLEIEGGPIARALPASTPVCGYYAATFETLFRALVSPRTSVEEIACEAMGSHACIFELRW